MLLRFIQGHFNQFCENLSLNTRMEKVIGYSTLAIRQDNRLESESIFNSRLILRLILHWCNLDYRKLCARYCISIQWCFQACVSIISHLSELIFCVTRKNNFPRAKIVHTSSQRWILSKLSLKHSLLIFFWLGWNSKILIYFHVVTLQRIYFKSIII